jgi:hypothetical protein
MTIADGQLTVRLARGVERLEERHLKLANAISAVALEHGAVADRRRYRGAARHLGRPDEIDIGFWRAVLGYAELADDNAVDPLGHGSTCGCRISTPPNPCDTRCTSMLVAREQAEHRLPHRAAGGASSRIPTPRPPDPRRPRRQPRLHRRLARWRTRMRRRLAAVDRSADVSNGSHHDRLPEYVLSRIVGTDSEPMVPAMS